MAAPHRHNEIELLFLLQGQVRYRFNLKSLSIPKRHLILFWSGLPHQVLSFSPNALLCGLEVPLSWYLQWKMPERLNQLLLGGRVLFEPDPEFSKSDSAQLIRWSSDLPSKRPGARMAALLEIEARLLRFSTGQFFEERSLVTDAEGVILSQADVNRIEHMARYIAENCTRPLRVEEVARRVSLHPNYAMKLFHRGFGVSFNNYLNELRVTHAQRILSMEDTKITEVGLGSGFGSLSRFNANFRKSCGMSPRKYRLLYGLQSSDAAAEL
jgi:AraC-like DNA-binding protein